MWASLAGYAPSRPPLIMIQDPAGPTGRVVALIAPAPDASGR